VVAGKHTGESLGNAAHLNTVNTGLA
jgi:hypothetical protein